jgi:hypothetical protein
MPRLDWQLWFAAMGRPADSPWTLPLLAGVLRGEPAVLGLLGDDPFPQSPPRYARLRLYDYRFNPQGSPAWMRQDLGLWQGPVALR